MQSRPGSAVAPPVGFPSSRLHHTTTQMNVSAKLATQSQTKRMYDTLLEKFAMQGNRQDEVRRVKIGFEVGTSGYRFSDFHQTTKRGESPPCD